MNISERKLVELRALGRSRASEFIDPSAVAQCTKVLRERGEQWAAAVLGRDISRRSIAVQNMPYLLAGEEYALILADAEEDRLVVEEMGR